jgi:pyridoxamine 5'-phosphate oxidase
MTERLTSLEAIEAAIWRELESAVVKPDHAWRTATLATVGDGYADARTVVLREIDVARRELLIYTDARSAKVAQIAACPQATLVLWSPVLEWQLRCRATLSVETSGLALSSRWARIKLTPGARDYLSPLPPGTPLTVPAHDLVPLVQFAVITATLDTLDWLELGAEGHRRAIFGCGPAHWVQP